MPIKLNNFVEINIQHENQSSNSGSRNTCTLILFNQEGNWRDTFTLDDYNKKNEKGHEGVMTTFKVYFDSFFKNTTQNSILYIISRTDEAIRNVGQTTEINNFLNILQDNDIVDYTNIVIASNATFEEIKKTAKDYNASLSSSDQIYKKIFLSYIPYRLDITDKEDVENLVVVFGNDYDAATPAVSHLASEPAVACVAVLSADVYVVEGRTYATRSAEPEGGNYGYLVDREGYVYTLVTPQGEENPSQEGWYAISELGANLNIAVNGHSYYTISRSTGEGKYDDGVYHYNAPTGDDTVVYPDITTGDPTGATNIATDQKYYQLDNIGTDYEVTNYYKGLELKVGAYLTQINIDNYESVQDYAYTEESVVDAEERAFQPVEDNALAVALINNQYNFIGKVISKNLNLGGNDSAGYSLVNQFMLICLQQTISEKLFGLLKNKIKYNTSGLNAVCSFLTQELQRYVDNGYLSTNKTWTGEDLYTKNGELLVRKNTPLTLGYKFVISPLSTLSLKDMEEHKLPLISILIADSYSIRKIEIDGKVF